MITHIIWDFNGTVLDDVNTAVAAVNMMLKSRSLPLTDIDIYRDNLVMPLEKYYETVGITNADIPTLSIEFREMSEINSHLSKIADGFIDTVTPLKKRGIKNILMSSLYEKYLNSEVDKYDIRKYFDYIEGMKDTAVGSKIDMAHTYLKNNNIESNNVLVVGDLLSDAELANALGCELKITFILPDGTEV